MERKVQQQCTFKPQINEHSRVIAPEHKAFDAAGLEYYQDKHERLMDNLEAKVTKDCTFRPTVLKKKKRIDLNAFAVPSYEVINQSMGYYGGNSL